MYCNKCHYGSIIWKPVEGTRCPQCGDTNRTVKRPFQTKISNNSEKQEQDKQKVQKKEDRLRTKNTTNEEVQ